MFSQEELADAAFQLLASSTAYRYITKAREFALASTIFNSIAVNQPMRDELLRNATEWADAVMIQQKREVEEVSLALAVPLLVEYMPNESRSLLDKLVTCDNPAAQWVKALVRAELARIIAEFDLTRLNPV